MFSCLVLSKELFPASGAVLVCGAILAELFYQLMPWRNDGKLQKFLTADFVDATIISRSGAGIQLNALTASRFSPHENRTIPTENVISAGTETGTLDGQVVKQKIQDLEPIFLLYELATKNHTEPFEVTPGTNQNPYIAGQELTGWVVYKTLRFVDACAAALIAFVAVLGTVIWGYAEHIM